jgi:hypothetical protein
MTLLVLQLPGSNTIALHSLAQPQMSLYRQLDIVPAVILHATSALCMAYGFNSLSGLAINAWIEGQKGGHYQFLTVQGYSPHLSRHHSSF